MSTFIQDDSIQGTTTTITEVVLGGPLYAYNTNLSSLSSYSYLNINNLNNTSTTIFNNLNSLSSNSVLSINNLNNTSTTILNFLNSLSTNSILSINNLNATSTTIFNNLNSLSTNSTLSITNLNNKTNFTNLLVSGASTINSSLNITGAIVNTSATASEFKGIYFSHPLRQSHIPYLPDGNIYFRAPVIIDNELDYLSFGSRIGDNIIRLYGTGFGFGIRGATNIAL